MLKALLKKQFLELNSYYFQNKKTGKNRSKASTAGMIILFVLLFAILGGTFYATGSMLADALIPMKLDWLYLCMMGMIAIALGTFGSVFNTYAGLYHAKDNDLLLSMPIPPSKILFVRMTGVYGMSLLYVSIVWIPTIIKYFISGAASPLSVIFCILQTFIITFFVSFLTCILGWVVALISSKLKNKSFVTVLASLAFLGIYYFAYFKANTFLQNIASSADEIGDKVKSVFYPFYLMGVGTAGEVLPMLTVTVIVAALFALAYFVLSKSFIKITTAKTAEKKTEYKSEQIKTTSVKSALLRKEFKRFAASPTYIMNCGLGVIIALALCVVAIIKTDYLRDLLLVFSAMFPGVEELFPTIACCFVCLLFSMNQITAPSVSLEGKNIWIVQSLPVDPKEVLMAKQKLHMIINIPGSVIAAAVLGYIIQADFTTVIYMIVLAAAYIMFTASFGLFLNLKNPNLTWTNETVPVKQSSPVAIGLFGGWALSLAIGGIGYLLYNAIGLAYYIFACAIVLLFAARFINNWLYTKGVQIFTNL